MPIAEALERLLLLHDTVGSPIRQFLRAPLTESGVRERLADLDLVPHPQLIQLYGLHDGVDEEAWAEVGVPYALLVRDGVRFPSAAAAVQLCRELRKTDAELATSPAWELSPGALWRASWFPVFALTRSDENIAIECDADSLDFGRLWVVRWNAAQEEIIAGSLDEFLVTLADRFEAVRTRWDEDVRLLDCDDELAGPVAWP